MKSEKKYSKNRRTTLQASPRETPGTINASSILDIEVTRHKHRLRDIKRQSGSRKQRLEFHRKLPGCVIPTYVARARILPLPRIETRTRITLS